MIKLQKSAAIITIILSAIFSTVFSKSCSAEYTGISENESEINFTTKDFSLETVEKNGIKFTGIVSAETVFTSKKGYAELPVWSTSFLLEDDKDVTVSLSAADYKEIILEYPLLPSRGTIYRNQDPHLIQYSVDPESVVDSWYPLEPVSAADPFIFRDFRGINISFYPVQYNAHKKTLRLYERITVKLEKKSSGITNPISVKPSRIDPSMGGIYSSLFINYPGSKFMSQLGEAGEILVIHTPRDAEAIQPYIDWKRQKGFKVSSTEVPAGTNARSVIETAYAGNPDILFVQIAGDWADIKSDLGTSGNAPMDPMLGCVAGSDLYPELIVGRFSAESTADLTVQIEKTINYEKNPDLTGGWYGSGLGIGSPEGEGIGDDGEIDYAHIEIIKENKLIPFTYETVYEAYSNPSSTVVANYINSGLGIINYCGHGSNTSWGTSGYSNTNINNSTNGSKLPFIFSVACVNGAFHSGTCFAEAWLRKSGGGAVATLMSTINQPWVPPMRGQDYMNDILTGGYDYSSNPGSGTITTLEDKRTSFGSISMNGCVLMLAEQAGDVSTRETIQTWTIFGDASLQIRTDKPQFIENTNEIIFPDLYQTKIISGGEPAAGAKVSLYQNGVNYSSTTDTNGDVVIEHGFTEGDILLTVSGFNLETTQITVPVQSPEGPYLKIGGYSFSSVCSGDTVYADLTIRNIGLSNSDGISVAVSCGNRYITMISDSYQFNSVIVEPEGQIVLNSNISFRIDPEAPDQERIKLDVTLSDSHTKRSYESDIYIIIDSPVISVSHVFSTPSAIQGQTRNLIVRIDNTGHAPVYDLTAAIEQITTFNSTISDPVHIDSIAAGSFTEASFDCFYGNDIPNSSYLIYNLTVNSVSGYSLDYEFDTVVGITDGFETGDFAANEWLFSGDREWIIDSTVFYDGNFSANSGSVGDGQKSAMITSFNFIADGNISFYRKVSSEAGYDKLSFYIDGSLKKTWSGISDWAKFTFDVTTGIHEFKWEFSRDASMGNGSNCAWIDNILAAGISTTSINDHDSGVPSAITLYQNYPNPFNPVTQIKFSLDKVSNVRLNVYNITGQIVYQTAAGLLGAGFHTVEFDGSKLNSGIYYYTLEAEGKSFTKKMILMK